MRGREDGGRDGRESQARSAEDGAAITESGGCAEEGGWRDEDQDSVWGPVEGFEQRHAMTQAAHHPGKLWENRVEGGAREAASDLRLKVDPLCPGVPTRNVRFTGAHPGELSGSQWPPELSSCQVCIPVIWRAQEGTLKLLLGGDGETGGRKEPE